MTARACCRILAALLQIFFGMDIMVAAKHAQAAAGLKSSQHSRPLHSALFGTDAHWWTAKTWPIMHRLRELLQEADCTKFGQAVNCLCELLSPEVSCNNQLILKFSLLDLTLQHQLAWH